MQELAWESPSPSGREEGSSKMEKLKNKAVFLEGSHGRVSSGEREPSLPPTASVGISLLLIMQGQPFPGKEQQATLTSVLLFLRIQKGIPCSDYLPVIDSQCLISSTGQSEPMDSAESEQL